MNQFQTAYEQGKMDKWDKITETMDKVRAEHEAGKYVVMIDALTYCPYTDAAMGTMPHILATFETHQAAVWFIENKFEEFMDNDAVDVYIYPKQPATKQATEEFEDIPF
jgi:hypothetical protein